MIFRKMVRRGAAEACKGLHRVFLFLALAY